MTRCVLVVVAAMGLCACSGTTTPGPDSGSDGAADAVVTPSDGASPDTPAQGDSGGMDAAAGDDTGSSGDAGGGDTAVGTDTASGTDTGASDDATLRGDGAVMCAPRVECAGFPTSGYPTDATSVDNCAGMAHRTDCCGATRVFGINHGARTTLCPAETLCRMQYAAPATCMSNTITTDTGESTTVMDQVRVRCVGASGATCRCETFVCTSSACLATSRPVGSCG